MLTHEQLADTLVKVLNAGQSKETYLLCLARKEVTPIIQTLNTLALSLSKKDKEEIFILISALSEVALGRKKEENTSPPILPTGEKSSVLGKLKKTE